MKLKIGLVLFGIIAIFSCNNPQKNANAPDMYEVSPMSELMREMVIWSKDAKQKLQDSLPIVVPEKFFELAKKEGTRDEHLDQNFQDLAKVYLAQLQKIKGGKNQAYFYNESINACKSCHNNFCGGPLVVIDQLGL